jgi:formylglycine-generating enzyme
MPRSQATEAVQQSPWWIKVSGARWSRPYGPDSDLEGLWDHPVVHVSYNDGEAYCHWRGGRLPTEAEWERAARGGVEDAPFPWGHVLVGDDGVHHCNIWQGVFPHTNTAEDGHRFTAPVLTYAPNDYGLHQMIGNVWEWTRSPFVQSSRAKLATRGGSFLCHEVGPYPLSLGGTLVLACVCMSAWGRVGKRVGT